PRLSNLSWKSIQNIQISYWLRSSTREMLAPTPRSMIDIKPHYMLFCGRGSTIKRLYGIFYRRFFSQFGKRGVRLTTTLPFLDISLQPYETNDWTVLLIKKFNRNISIASMLLPKTRVYPPII